MIIDWGGCWTQEKGFELKLVDTKTDLSLGGANILYLIEANENEKIVVQSASFPLCLIKEAFRASFLQLDMKV